MMFVIFLFYSYLKCNLSKVISLRDNSEVSHFIESDNVQLLTSDWITITTINTFITPIIFLRLEI